jgi:hypothetical protein
MRKEALKFICNLNEVCDDMRAKYLKKHEKKHLKMKEIR